MAAGTVPAAEVDVTEPLVRRLLADQHPDLAARSLAIVANGWDNVIVRIGDDLAARLPRRRMGADLVEHEHRWLPDLAARLPIPIAAPVRQGLATTYYPWRWSICPWFDGSVAADVELAEPPAEAERLGRFVAALHTAAPPDAPHNPHRGQPVAELVPRIVANLERLSSDERSDPAITDDVDVAALRRLLDRLGAVEDWPGPPVWLHGDLHSANLIVADGRIAAVLDFGDITSGDPAVDLAVAWMLFDDAERTTFRRAAGGSGSSAGSATAVVDDDTWDRAALWGLHFGLLYLAHSADSERFGRMGRRLLAALAD